MTVQSTSVAPRAADDPSQPTVPGLPVDIPQKPLVVSLWPYDAIEDNELSFRSGVIFEVIEECNEDWWEGVIDGVRGYFPANRVTYLDASRAPQKPSQVSTGTPIGISPSLSVSPGIVPSEPTSASSPVPNIPTSHHSHGPTTGPTGPSLEGTPSPASSGASSRGAPLETPVPMNSVSFPDRPFPRLASSPSASQVPQTSDAPNSTLPPGLALPAIGSPSNVPTPSMVSASSDVSATSQVPAQPQSSVAATQFSQLSTVGSTSDPFQGSSIASQASELVVGEMERPGSASPDGAADNSGEDGVGAGSELEVSRWTGAHGWVAVEDERGQTYYYNEKTEQTTWELPEELSQRSATDRDGEADEELAALELELPRSWRAARDSEGQVYYFHEETGETKWEKPDLPDSNLDISRMDTEGSSHSPSFGEKDTNPSLLPGPPPLLGPSPAAKAIAAGDGNVGLNLASPAKTTNSVMSTDSHITEDDVSKGESVPLFHHDDDDDAEVVTAISKMDLGLVLDPIPTEYIIYEGVAQLRLEKGEDRFLKKDWKAFHLVLSEGCVVVYKDTPKKEGHGLPFGHVDIAGARLEIATKDQTRKKNAIALHCRTGNRYLILTKDDTDCATWFNSLSVAANSKDSAFVVMNAVLKYEATIADKKRILPRFLERKPDKKEDAATLEKERRTSGKKDELSKPSSGSFGSLLDEDGDKQKKKGFGGLFAKRAPNIKEPQDPRANVFGGLLDVQLSKTPGRHIPRIVELCIKEVEHRGLDSQGIYRLSGNSALVQKMKQQFNSSLDPDTVVLSDDDTADINNLTSLLKLYFRELQNPLIPFDMYEHFVEASRIMDYDERLYAVKRLIDELPPHNRTVLEYLVRHLQKVVASADINKMEPNNIAIVFGPTLLRPPDDSAGNSIVNMMNMGGINSLVSSIVEQADWVFAPDVD
ncbi:RhoGAP-domain-containing protein, partial [Gonapodya prolifera JEL478]